VAELRTTVKVACYSGFKADERPLHFWLRDRCLTVETVEDRWYSPGFTYFRVVVSGGDRYVLRYDEGQETWTIEAFRAADRDFR